MYAAPELENLEQMSYLSTLFTGVYLKDIVECHDIELPAVFSGITDVLCSYAGSLTNVESIKYLADSKKYEYFRYNSSQLSELSEENQ